MNKLIASLFVLASVTPSRAEDNPGDAVDAVESFIHYNTPALYGDPKPELVKNCEAAVAAAKQQHSPTLERTGGTYAVADADKVCAEGALLNVRLAAHKVFKDLIWSMRMLRTDMMPSDEFVAGVLASVDDCNKAVDSLLAANIPATQPYEIKGDTKDGPKVFATTVAEIKPNICEAAKTAAAQFTKAAAQVAAKAREKYTKVGIKDDKLSLMLGYDGSVFLPGGTSSGDMKKYAAASTLFVWLTSDPDAQDFVVHTIRRYQYKANKLVSQTEKTYRRKRSAKLGSAPFK